MTSAASEHRRRRARFGAAALAALACVVPACAKSASEWRVELTDSDPYVRAMAAIGFCTESPEHAIDAFPVLLELLLSQDDDVRGAARHVLAEVTMRDPAAVLGVVLHAPDLEPEARVILHRAIPWAGKKAIPAIVAAMREPGRANPRMLATMLAEIGEPALDPLRDLFEHDPTPIVRASAAWALGELGPRAESALPSLLAAVDHDDVVVARVAIDSVARIDTSTQRAFPMLRASLSRRESYIREAACEALVQLHLSRAASHPSEWLVAANDVARCGEAGWTPLVQALDKPDPAARRFAEQCLVFAVARLEVEHALRSASALAATGATVDTKPLQAQPSVQAITGHDIADSPLPRGLTVLALARGGERSLPLVPLLGYALADPASSVRWCAALAILSIAVDSSRVLAGCGPWSFSR